MKCTAYKGRTKLSNWTTKPGLPSLERRQLHYQAVYLKYKFEVEELAKAISVGTRAIQWDGYKVLL